MMNAILSVSSIIFPLITYPYVTRILGPDGIGKVGMAQSVINYFTLAAQLGVPIYGIRECAKRRDDKEALSRLAYELLILSLITTVISYAVYYLCITCVPKLAGEKNLYMLMGVSFSAVFSNRIPQRQLEQTTTWFHPILGVSLLAAIVDLGAPLDYHLILGAGFYTFVYIASRACGKYFGARAGARATHMPTTVQKYLGLTLLPHSGVSLVFTGIVCSVLAASQPELSSLVKGTIAAAAVINEIIAVIAAKKGFELAGEVGGNAADA